MDVLILIPMLVVVIIVFFYLGWLFNSKIGKRNILSAEAEAKRIIDDSEKEAKNIKREKLLEVKDEWYKKKTEFDKEVNQKRQKLSQLEKQLQQREENSEKKFDLILQKERENKKYESDLTEEKNKLDNRTEEIKRIEEEQNLKLEKISGLTTEEAKELGLDYGLIRLRLRGPWEGIITSLKVLEEMQEFSIHVQEVGLKAEGGDTLLRIDFCTDMERNIPLHP